MNGPDTEGSSLSDALAAAPGASFEMVVSDLAASTKAFVDAIGSGPPIESSEADAIDIDIPTLPTGVAAPMPDTRVLRALAAAIELCLHVDVAFAGRFPSHPKPSQTWWEEIRAQTQTLYPLLLMGIETESART